MNWAERSLALLLLVVWPALTVHCRLEVLPGLGFLACCLHEGNEPHQDTDCDEDGCAVVESGHYMIQENSLPVAPAAPAMACVILDLYLDLPCVPRPDLGAVGLAPPDIPSGWKFSHRAALPPRAPSLVA